MLFMVLLLCVCCGLLFLLLVWWWHALRCLVHHRSHHRVLRVLRVRWWSYACLANLVAELIVLRCQRVSILFHYLAKIVTVLLWREISNLYSCLRAKTGKVLQLWWLSVHLIWSRRWFILLHEAWLRSIEAHLVWTYFHSHCSRCQTTDLCWSRGGFHPLGTCPKPHILR